jgi:hypothetical protein
LTLDLKHTIFKNHDVLFSQGQAISSFFRELHLTRQIIEAFAAKET